MKIVHSIQNCKFEASYVVKKNIKKPFILRINFYPFFLSIFMNNNSFYKKAS